VVTVARGEVWLVNLDPTVGSEIRKTRPAVVISPPEMHDHVRTVLIAPMTTGSRAAPFRVEIVFQGKRGLVLLDQVRAVDKARLVKKLGAVGSGTLDATLSTLREIFEP
jgi:mRNA interferase MazF